MKDDSNRSLRRVNRKSRSAADRTVEVDSSAFFAEDPSPTPPPRKKPGSSAPRRSGAPAQAAAARPSAFGRILLPVQGILSAASLVQLWRTQMLPVLYLVILAALLFLLWLLVKRCQEYNVPGKVSRVFSVFLCACMALGCVWAQQGLTALDNMTNGLLTGAEANKITKEPFVIYLSGVDTRGELTEKARSDVNILAVVNPQTKQVALINTPRDYYVDLAGTNSKDKLTHAGLYGVETSMATLGNLYGINVDHYIRINFAGFINIVDALGGVDVYSDQAFTSVGSPGYYDPTTFAEGWNHLDGKSALAFARERHAFASGDIQPDEGHRRHAEQDQVPCPAHGLFQDHGRRFGLLCHRFFAGSDQCAGAHAAERFCQLGHPELHRHRLLRHQHPVLFRQGPEALRHEAG